MRRRDEQRLAIIFWAACSAVIGFSIGYYSAAAKAAALFEEFLATMP